MTIIILTANPQNYSTLNVLKEIEREVSQTIAENFNKQEDIIQAQGDHLYDDYAEMNPSKEEFYYALTRYVFLVFSENGFNLEEAVSDLDALKDQYLIKENGLFYGREEKCQ